jgi:hypothetical protein
LRKFVDAALAEALDRLGHPGTKAKGRKASSPLPECKAPHSQPAKPAEPVPPADERESGDR